MDGSVKAKVGRVVRGAAPYKSRQGTVYAAGISAETVGAQSLFLGLVTLPPGERTRAHVHERHESAFYLMSGEEVELWTGCELEHRDVAHPGDYLFIPANVPHVAVNRGAVAAVFIGARNEASVHEAADMRPELEGLVP